MSASPPAAPASRSPSPVPFRTNVDEPAVEQEAPPEEVGGTSFYPSPPLHYKRFTKRNLELAAVLKERGNLNGHLAEGEAEPDFNLLNLLDPPDLGFIAAEGGWHVFGEFWPVSRRPDDIVTKLMLCTDD